MGFKGFLFKYKSELLKTDFTLGTILIKEDKLEFLVKDIDLSIFKQEVDIESIQKLLLGIKTDINSLDKEDIYGYIKYFVNDFYFQYCEEIYLEEDL